MDGVGDWDISMDLERCITDILERSSTAMGRCRETGTEAWSWNGLSRSMGGVGRLGQTHGLGTIYHVS